LDKFEDTNMTDWMLKELDDLRVVVENGEIEGRCVIALGIHHTRVRAVLQ
jgi:hypothetical protein